MAFLVHGGRGGKEGGCISLAAGAGAAATRGRAPGRPAEALHAGRAGPAALHALARSHGPPCGLSAVGGDRRAVRWRPDGTAAGGFGGEAGNLAKGEPARPPEPRRATANSSPSIATRHVRSRRGALQRYHEPSARPAPRGATIPPRWPARP